MQLIPPAKDCAPVRIRFAFYDRVMNAVHPRGDEHEIENALQPDWQPPVRVVKQSGAFERNKKPEEEHGMNAEEHHRETEKANRKNHFAEMKASGRAHIHVEVGVMHIMKAPEEWQSVIRPVPPPVGVIH